MSYFGLTDLNSVNTLFSGFSNKTSSQTGVSSSSILSDYAGIRNGSYKKLLNAYYNKTGSSAVSGIAGSKTSTSTSKDSVKTLSRIEDAAEGLKESADALRIRGTKSVFQKETKTASDGTVTEEYNRDAIYQKVSAFVENYNSLIKSTEESNTKVIAQYSAQMIQSTNANERALEDIGITIGKDDTLSIDKEAFQKADMNKVKTLFYGTGSYGYQMSVKASMIDDQAQREAEKANTYGSNGRYNYNYSYGSSYNDYF